MKKLLTRVSGKNKLRLFIAAFILLCWMIYPLTVAKTLELRNQVNEMQLLNDSVSDIPSRRKAAEQELRTITALMSDSTSDQTILRERILNEVTSACAVHNVTLREFSPCRRFTNEDWIIETHPVLAEGTFFSLLKMLREVELSGSGIPVSVAIYTHTDKQTKKRSTRAQLYIQNMITAP